MPIVIGIIANGDIETVAKLDETSHRPLGRAIHTDHAVFVQSHKTKGGIDGTVYQFDIEIVMLGDHIPVIQARATQGVNTDLELGVSNGSHIDDFV